MAAGIATTPAFSVTSRQALFADRFRIGGSSATYDVSRDGKTFLMQSIGNEGAQRIVVEWKPQARTEAGDLLLAAPGVFDWNDVMELSTVIGSSDAIRQSDRDIIVYKAIGVGLEDVALAELIHRRLSQPR